SKHKINFISIISIISVIGITIGVAALIIVLSVFNGFGSLVTSFLMNFEPHIRVEMISAEANSQTIEKTLLSTGGINDYSPFVSGKVLVYNFELTSTVTLKGIDEKKADDIYGIKKSILFGKFDINKESNFPKAIIGLQLADRLQTLIGDTITIISPTGIEKALTQAALPTTKKFIVSGIYSSDNNDYDASYIFSAISECQNLLGYKKNIQGFEIKLDDVDQSFNIKEKLSAELNPKQYSINTWYDFHKDLYTVMQIERGTAYIILCLIIAVATFNILGSLSMSVIEKKRDIGVLRTMGAEEKSILKIFMFEGLLIGIIGTAAGIFIGYFVCYLQIKFNIYPLDPTQYKIDSLPVELRLSDFFYISGASMLLSFLASLYPAKKAVKVNIVESIKWE
ncbi:MAG TPA: ABC transporter permease, partial [Ignavibacteriaceae bacterium]|nr:ABC transporter permease [Ignavibacteriaceae bacterium]